MALCCALIQETPDRLAHVEGFLRSEVVGLYPSALLAGGLEELASMQSGAIGRPFLASAY